MRTSLLSLLAVLVIALVGCDKPTDAECRVAIQNMRKLLTTDKVNAAAGDVESAVRRCRGNSSKKSVQCAGRAQTLDDLKACGLLPEVKPEPAKPEQPKK
jgi:hypothetical protein